MKTNEWPLINSRGGCVRRSHSEMQAGLDRGLKLWQIADGVQVDAAALRQARAARAAMRAAALSYRRARLPELLAVARANGELSQRLMRLGA